MTITDIVILAPLVVSWVATGIFYRLNSKSMKEWGKCIVLLRESNRSFNAQVARSDTLYTHLNQIAQATKSDELDEGVYCDLEIIKEWHDLIIDGARDAIKEDWSA